LGGRLVAAPCAKPSERFRLVAVAPTLSPMPNGKPYSGASGTAEFASSAIAFRRIDYRLKPRLNASARVSPRAPRTTREAAMAAFAKSWRRSCTARADEVTRRKISRPRSRGAGMEKTCARCGGGVGGLGGCGKKTASVCAGLPEYVDRIGYWALADVIREPPWFGPSTTTSAPAFTRL